MPREQALVFDKLRILSYDIKIRHFDNLSDHESPEFDLQITAYK